MVLTRSAALAAALLSLTAPAQSRPDEARPPAEPVRPTCTLPWAIRGVSRSATCLACHRPALATAVGSVMLRHAGGDHGQGVDYAAAQARGALHLRPVGELPPAIVLTDGRVACTTCHDGRSEAAHHLARPGTFANVCVGCHDL